jgi:hypothetical protein
MRDRRLRDRSSSPPDGSVGAGCYQRIRRHEHDRVCLRPPSLRLPAQTEVTASPRGRTLLLAGGSCNVLAWTTRQYTWERMFSPAPTRRGLIWHSSAPLFLASHRDTGRHPGILHRRARTSNTSERSVRRRLRKKLSAERSSSPGPSDSSLLNSLFRLRLQLSDVSVGSVRMAGHEGRRMRRYIRGRRRGGCHSIYERGSS